MTAVERLAEADLQLSKAQAIAGSFEYVSQDALTARLAIEDARASLRAVSRGVSTPESGEPGGAREQAAESSARVVSTEGLIREIRESANAADAGAQGGGTKADALASSALRLELRAAALHVVDAIDDLRGAVLDANRGRE